jgi:DNA-binding transcriptional ArsR family regulator
MDLEKTLIAFDALSQETRLRAFRLLVEHGHDGLAAGDIAAALGVPQNTMSFHLSHMNNAGLVQTRRDGRSVIYSVDFEFFTGLIRFMVQDCCRADIATMRQDCKSGLSVIELMDCCAPARKSRKKGKSS